MNIPNQCITETFYDKDTSTIMTNFYCFKTNFTNTYNHTNPLEKKYLSDELYDDLLEKVSISTTANNTIQKYKTKKKLKTNKIKQTKKNKQKQTKKNK